jgi:16S rRNA (cytosine1402-N4)-methyltransferase
MDQNPSSSNDSSYHRPVMATEVVDLFREAPDGLLVDMTLGGGGHTRALLDAFPDRTVLALDRDPDAATQAPADPRLHFVAANFGDLTRVLREHAETSHEHRENGVGRRDVAGVLFDLGVSSHQLDVGSRGFSYHRSGPLDMRMGPDAGRTAGELVNELPARELARIFRRYGEERFATRIAAAIVEHRPIGDTLELATVIAEAVPAPARRRRHPARKVFQAIRIAVNGELEALGRGLDAAIDATRPGGRIVVISYHSLEDRIVKRRFTEGAAGCDCPPDFPICTCGKVAELRRLTRKPLRPTEDEVTSNPRARSALLRAVEIADAEGPEAA